MDNNNTAILNKNWNNNNEKEKLKVTKKVTVAVDSMLNCIAGKGLSVRDKVKLESFLGIMSGNSCSDMHL